MELDRDDPCNRDKNNNFNIPVLDLSSTMASSSSSMLRLYKALLREANLFADFNYR